MGSCEFLQGRSIGFFRVAFGIVARLSPRDVSTRAAKKRARARNSPIAALCIILAKHDYGVAVLPACKFYCCTHMCTVPSE